MSCNNCRCTPCECPTQPVIVQLQPTEQVPEEVSPACPTPQWYETLAGSFTMPACGATVIVQVCDATKYTLGMWVWINGIGYLTVVSIAGPQSLEVQNDCLDANAVPGTTVAAGAQMVPGQPVVLGTPVIPLRLSDETTQPFTVPAVGATVNIKITDSTWAKVGMTTLISLAGRYVITAIVDGTTITVQNTGDAGQNQPPTTLIGSGKFIYPMGAATPAPRVTGLGVWVDVPVVSSGSQLTTNVQQNLTGFDVIVQVRAQKDGAAVKKSKVVGYVDTGVGFVYPDTVRGAFVLNAGVLTDDMGSFVLFVKPGEYWLVNTQAQDLTWEDPDDLQVRYNTLPRA